VAGLDRALVGRLTIQFVGQPQQIARAIDVQPPEAGGHDTAAGAQEERLAALMTLGAAAQAQTRKPNILVIMGDDIGMWNVNTYNRGMMGYRTPNIDRIAKEGAVVTDLYAQQSCTAGRAAFITGQSPFRTGLLKVGLPGAKEGLSDKDPTLAELLKLQGYATGQFGKNLWATAMSSCRRCTRSTSSSATSTN